MKQICTTLLTAWMTAACVVAQVSDAGAPTLSPQQAKERADGEATRVQREESAKAARVQQLTTTSVPEETKRPAEFQFGGGDLSDFIESIHLQFGIDLRKVGTVPETMLYTVRVPKMRLKGRRPPSGMPAVTHGVHFSQVLDLYNSVSKEGNSTLGRWIRNLTDDGEPSLIMLVPPEASSQSTFSVRAFAFNRHRANELGTIQQLIALERDRLAVVLAEGRQPGLTRADIEGEVNYHGEAGIIVAKGGEVFVEMASAIIQAAKEKPEITEIQIPRKKEPEIKDE